MHKSQLEQLIAMINQIVTNNRCNDNVEQSAAVTLNHLEKFWARPMKQQIIDYVAQGGDQLLPAGQQAVQQLVND